jgi:HD-GYP domain-containing protein (c-di-GMP phosphodiesterase class II)
MTMTEPSPSSLAPAESLRSSVSGQHAEENAATAASTALLACVYRLFKVARMYDATHQMLLQECDVAATAIAEFCVARGADSADIVFVGETVFVNGLMPRFTREAYTRAIELGELLGRAHISNLTVSKTVVPQNLLHFVAMVARVLRDASVSSEMAGATFVAIRARRLRARIGGDAAEVDQSPAARVVRTYACAVVVLRQFYAAASKAEAKVPVALRRLAQRFVTHAEQEPVMLVGLAAGRARERDEAAIATATALVAVLMAKQVTTDRSILTNLGLAALLYDVGRHGLLHAPGRDTLVDRSMRTLTEDELDRVAWETALRAVSLDKVDSSAMSRVVIAFEAHWARRASRLGPLYRGRRQSSALAKMLATARAFSELMAPGPYATPMGPEDAIHFLGSRATDDSERLYVKLLTGALGIFPPGTTVELSTQEIAVVTRVPDNAVDFSRPPVRVMYDARGNKLSEPKDVDLAAPPADGEPVRMITRSFDADQEQAQAMRAYVLAVTSTHRSRVETSPAPPPKIPGLDSRSGKRMVPEDELTQAAPAEDSVKSQTAAASSREGPGGTGKSHLAPPPLFDDPSAKPPAPNRVSELAFGPLPSPSAAPAPPAEEERPPSTGGRRVVESGPISAHRGPSPINAPLSRPSSALAPGFAPPTPSSARSSPRAEESVSVPPASGSSPGPPSRRGAWKERQSQRQVTRDPRAERESERPEPPAERVERVVAPPLSRPSLPAASAPSSSSGAPPSPLHTTPTRPEIRKDTLLRARPAADITPPPTRASVAGTRKVSWDDYDRLVSQSEGPPISSHPGVAPSSGGRRDELEELRDETPAPVASRGEPARTRRATWEEAAELARLTEEETPGDDEGI